MAEENGEQNGNRVTLALVGERLATVAEQVSKVHALMDAGFLVLQRQLDALEGVPGRVGILEERVANLREDMGVLETQLRAEIASVKADAAKRHEYRIVTLPNLLVGAVGLVLMAVNIYVAVKLGGGASGK